MTFGPALLGSLVVLVAAPPKDRVSANPTPHPKIVSPHPGGRVQANPTPHPHPVPVLDVFRERGRLVVKLRATDGSHRPVLTSARKIDGVAFPTYSGGKGRRGKRAADVQVRKYFDAASPLISIACDGVASDGEKTWRFGPGSTFLFADGSKITLNAKGRKNRCASVDVMSDGKRVHVNVAKRGAATIGQLKRDRWERDGQTPDGLVHFQAIRAGKTSPDWVTIQRNADGAYAPGPEHAALRYELKDVMVTSLVDQQTFRELATCFKETRETTCTGVSGITVAGAKPGSGGKHGVVVGPGGEGQRGIVAMGRPRVFVVMGMVGVLSRAGFELVPR